MVITFDINLIANNICRIGCFSTHEAVEPYHYFHTLC